MDRRLAAGKGTARAVAAHEHDPRHRRGRPGRRLGGNRHAPSGFTGRILLIGEETWRPYERPPLSKAVLTDDPEPPIAYFHAAERYTEQGIELRLAPK